MPGSTRGAGDRLLRPVLAVSTRRACRGARGRCSGRKMFAHVVVDAPSTQLADEVVVGAVQAVDHALLLGPEVG